MAWNPTPEVGAARDFGQKFGYDEVIVLAVKRDGTVNGWSYGRTRALCDRAGTYLEPVCTRLEVEVADRFEDYQKGGRS